MLEVKREPVPGSGPWEAGGGTGLPAAGVPRPPEPAPHTPDSQTCTPQPGTWGHGSPSA